MQDVIAPSAAKCLMERYNRFDHRAVPSDSSANESDASWAWNTCHYHGQARPGAPEREVICSAMCVTPLSDGSSTVKAESPSG